MYFAVTVIQYSDKHTYSGNSLSNIIINFLVRLLLYYCVALKVALNAFIMNINVLTLLVVIGCDQLCNNCDVTTPHLESSIDVKSLNV